MTNVLDILEAHAPYLADSDEARMNARVAEVPFFDLPDYADLACRTCRCGYKIDGFDDYLAHLQTQIEGSIQ